MDLWTEKYRPATLDEYVWRDAEQRAKVESWLADGRLPHLIFSGVQGTGKTSLAKLLLKELAIPSGDILEVNASRERNVETVQDKIVGFASTWPLGPTGIKYVILDEADSMSPLAQRVLRGEMERLADICRFILTCNYPQRILPAIHSRCQSFHFEALDRDEFVARVGEILTRENVSFDIDILIGFVDSTYPDLRKCINLIQQHSRKGVLVAPVEQAAGKDWMFEMAGMFRSGKLLEARKLVLDQAQVEEYPEIYRFLYENLDLWGDADKQDTALLVVNKGLVNHALVADPEINLAATLVQLCRVSRGEL